MKKRRKNSKFLLLLLICFISVGFAYLSANLNIMGGSILKGQKWDVHWENVQVTPESVNVEKPSINSVGDTVNYSVS